VRNYEDDEWLEDNTLDPECIADEMWLNSTLTKEVATALADLEDMVRTRLYSELTHYGYSDRDASAYMKKVIASEPGSEHVILIDIAQKEMDASGYLSKMNGIVRALQGYLNHRVQRNMGGEPYSLLLVHAQMTREEFGRTQPQDMGAFCIALRDAHIAVDAIGLALRDSVQKENEEFAERMSTFAEENDVVDRMKKYFDEKVGELTECTGIAHHALDWYMLSAPWNVFREKEKLAAICFDIVLRINNENDYFFQTYTRRELSPLGGWKGNMGTVALSAVASIRDHVQDVSLFFPSFAEIYFPDELPPHLANDARVRAVSASLSMLLERMNSSMTVNEIIWTIYRENKSSQLTELLEKLEIFDLDPSLQHEAIMAINDAWNTLPHCILGDRSPEEMMRDEKNFSGNNKTNVKENVKKAVETNISMWDDN
jgi:hypothetical protein